MKYLPVLQLCFLSFATQAQTLRPADFYKCYDFNKKTDHGFLKKKGFDIITDSAQKKAGTYSYRKTATNELADISYDLVYEANGGYRVQVNYYVPQLKQYNSFIAALKTSKFRYSKRNKAYISPFESSYSGQVITPKGVVKFHGVQYYLVEFVAEVGKELSPVPLPPGTAIPLPVE